MPVVEVLGGTGAFLRAESVSSPGVFLPGTIASRLGVRVAESIELTSGERPEIRGVFDFPEDGRDGRLGNSIIAPVTDDAAFDECWIHLRPFDRRKFDVLLFAAEGEQTNAGLSQIMQLNTTMGNDPRFEDQFRARSSRALNSIGAFLAIALGFATIWVRRLELSTAMQLGVSCRALTGQLASEALAWVVPGSVLLWSVGFAFATSSIRSQDMPAMITDLTVQCAIQSAAIVVGAVLAVALISPRLQYHYLRSR